MDKLSGYSDNIDGWGTMTSGDGTCCESGEFGDEFFIPGVVDSRVSCCNDLIDGAGDRTVSIGGNCVQTKAYWADMQGAALVPSKSHIGNSVQMRVDNVELPVGTNVTFEVWEADGQIDTEHAGSGDDAIRTLGLGNEVIGVVDGNHNDRKGIFPLIQEKYSLFFLI